MKISHYRIKLLQLVLILFITVPFQANAALKIVACFESYSDTPLLKNQGQEEISYLTDKFVSSLIGSTDNQDCIVANSISYDFTQTLNIGSQSSGAGAGKVTFDPLILYKNVDSLSAYLFLNMAAGTPFKSVNIFFIQTSPGSTKYTTTMMVQFGLVAVSNMAVSAKTGDTNLNNNEILKMEYGGVKVTLPGGPSLKPIISGWDRVKNISSVNADGIPNLSPPGL